MSLVQLDQEQAQIRDMIRAEAARRGAPRVMTLAAMEIGLVESNLHNLAGGDADSEGWRQERKSIYKDPRNLQASIRRVFDEMEQAYDGRMTSGQLAAAVQRPAAQYRGRYQQRLGDARALAGDSSSSSPGAMASGRGGEMAPAAASTTLTPADKLGAVLSMLRHHQSPVEALLGLQQAEGESAPTVAQQILASPSLPAAGGAEPQRRARDDSERSLFAPGGRFAGTEGPLVRISRLMHARGLTTSSGKRERHSTATGGWSDHALDKPFADARDWSGSVQQMDDAAVELARDLGIKGYKRGQPLVATVNHNGIRYQVLYRTNIGGDHYTHIHLGLAKEGRS